MRKSVFLLFILLSLSLFVFASIYFISSVKAEDDPTTSDSWPMFGYDPRHTRFSPSSAPHTPILLWKFNPFPDELYLSNFIETSPAVADGRVFIASSSSTDKKVYSLNETDGTLIWSYETNGRIFSSPAVFGDKVFLGSRDSNVYCLNTTNGALIWNYTIDGGLYHSSPAVVNDRVFIGGESYLYCLNATNGDYIWRFLLSTYSSPAVVDGKVFVGGGGPIVRCFNETTGESIWNSTTIDDAYRSSPAVVNGRVFIGSQSHHVYSLNETDGKQIWNYTASSPITSSPAVADGRVFIASHDGNIYCLNETTGAQIWTYKASRKTDSSPAVANGMVFINEGGVHGLMALNETTGALVWNYTVAIGTTRSSPAVANSKIFAGFGEGVFCVGSPPVLTVYVNGVSSHSPVTVTLNGTGVDTVYDGHPLEIVLYDDRVPITATIGINSTRVWSIDPNSQYSFTGWSGPATGTNTSNPITIALSANSSCTANYKTQHLTNIRFKDNTGTISLNPTQIEALAPDGSPVTLSSFSNQWLDNGTWTLKQVLWQGNNVKPSIDPTYNSTPGGTWDINCRVYSVNFTDSFKDNGGTSLYVEPASFRLTFPNDTISTPLEVGTYLIQNGTTTWSSIIWQGTEVVPIPSHTFDATDGNPTVNCMVYSLTVDPVFYDNTGTVIIQPSSWSIEFPNGTIRTVSSSVTYNQTQAGNYSIVSIIWKGVEVVPDIMPTTSLTSDKLWSPSINCLLPTSLYISLSSSTSYVGFKVEINGNLTCNEVGLSGAPILLSYSITGGESWNDITLINTISDRGYSAEWMPSATGNYLVRATWAGNSTYPATNTTINLAVTPFKEQNVFSVTSNSTVSEFAFNSTSRELSFTVTGPSDTTGYVNVYIAKTLVDNIADVTVYLDGDQLNYTATSLDDSWHLHFTYLHSTHKVTISLGSIFTPFIETPLGKVLIYGVSITAIIILITLYIYKKKHIQTSSSARNMK